MNVKSIVILVLFALAVWYAWSRFVADKVSV